MSTQSKIANALATRLLENENNALFASLSEQSVLERPNLPNPLSWSQAAQNARLNLISWETGIEINSIKTLKLRSL
jgi:hypothetical protein